MSGQFHITIGAAPHGGLDLSHDLALLKAALLYAYKVKLCTPTTMMLFITTQLTTLNEDQRLELVRMVAEMQGQIDQFDHNVAMYKQLRSKRRRTRQELIT